jgi:hypothetical protein
MQMLASSARNNKAHGNELRPSCLACSNQSKYLLLLLLLLQQLLFELCFKKAHTVTTAA